MGKMYIRPPCRERESFLRFFLRVLLRVLLKEFIHKFARVRSSRFKYDFYIYNIKIYTYTIIQGFILDYTYINKGVS